jgi:hypothetical protein
MAPQTGARTREDPPLFLSPGGWNSPWKSKPEKRENEQTGVGSTCRLLEILPGNHPDKCITWPALERGLNQARILCWKLQVKFLE